MRRAFFTVHKYAGLILGLLLAVIGLTGSLLVFDHALDEVLTPQTVAFQSSTETASFSTVLANAQAAVAGNPQPRRLYVQRAPDSPHVVRFPNTDKTAGSIEVSVSPVDGKVLAVRTWGQYPMTWLYSLHYTLLSGENGKIIVGLMGLVLLLFCVSGIVIWWPRKNRWRNALTLRRGSNRFRFYFDLHKVAGIYMLPLLFVVGFSGVSMIFPAQVGQLVGWVLPMEPKVVAQSVQSEHGRAPLGVDRVVEIAQQYFPNGVLKRIDLPRSDSAPYRLSFNVPSELWSNHGASRVWLDQYSGEVLDRRVVGEQAAGTTFMAWQFPLHNADVLGLAGRWLFVLVGIAPALLFGTGVYLWWRKRVLKNNKRVMRNKS
ncbi:PepSY-associated TM helix domain-containing protein [Pseudomaricurvus sp.]|uniref:PepSY-associated TM helix domain-containing protein n=1 Tax=Pseudomaricurvus sp. TaxID=2004510 RepID=UPI003F6C9895